MTPLILLISLSLLNLLNPLLVWAQARSSAPFVTPPNQRACAILGVNFATPYVRDLAYYQKVAAYSMGWTLEIANRADPQATIDGVKQAQSLGLTPIIRIGVGSDSGGFFQPADYVAFLNQIASAPGINRPFYAVAGPNEPDSERWLDPRSPQYNPGNELPVSQRRIDDINYAGRLLADYMNAVATASLDSKVQLLSPTINLSSWTADYFIQAMIAADAHFDLLAGFSGTSYNDLAGQTAKVKKYPETASLPLVLTEIGDTRGASFLLPQVAQIKSGLNGVIAALLFNAFNTNTGWSDFALDDGLLAQVLGPECAADVQKLTTVRPTVHPTARPCTTEDNPEFHPLRPYPGEPCDPLIPRSVPAANLPPPELRPQSYDTFAAQLDKDYQLRNSVAFSCGNSLDPNTPEKFDEASAQPYDPGLRGRCQVDGGHVTCYLRENFDLTLDLTNANIPILGNTQTRGLTDAVKMTEYLSWFLNGTVQQSEQVPNPSIRRLVNYSGPLQKLLAFDLKNAVRSWLVEGPAGEPRPAGQYHNYIVGCQQDINLDYFKGVLKTGISAVFSTLKASLLNLVAPPLLLGDTLADLLITAPDLYAQVTELLQSPNLDVDNIVRLLNAAGHTNLARDLSLIAEANLDAARKIGQYMNTYARDVAVSCKQSDAYIRLKQFRGRLPPDPAQYNDFKKYWDDYIWWTGYINLPLVGPVDVPNINIPFTNIGIGANIWAQLFQNIPFSSLEDTTGEVVISVSPETHANMQDKDVVDAQSQPGATLKLIIKPKP